MRFDNYSIGDTVHEGNTSCGVIVSMACHPERPTLGYMLLRDEKNQFTIYACLRDAVCHPFLARYIPDVVMRGMMKQAFEGGPTPDIPKIERKRVEKSPVQDENWVPEGALVQGEPVEPVDPEAPDEPEEPVGPEGPFIDFP